MRGAPAGVVPLALTDKCFLRMTAWESSHLSWAHLSAWLVVFFASGCFLSYKSVQEREVVSRIPMISIHPLTMLGTVDSWGMGDVRDLSAVEP